MALNGNKSNFSRRPAPIDSKHHIHMFGDEKAAKLIRSCGRSIRAKQCFEHKMSEGYLKDEFLFSVGITPKDQIKSKPEFQGKAI